MQSRAGRPGRDAERLGDLDQGQAQVVMEHEDRAVLDRQAAKRAVEGVAVTDRGDAIRPGRPVGGQEPDVGRP